MSAESNNHIPQFSRNRLALVMAFVGTFVYVVAFYVFEQPSWASSLRWLLTTPKQWVNACVDAAYRFVGLPSPPTRLVGHAGYLVIVSGLVPWLTMTLLQRGRPRDLGLRIPNRLAWRLSVIGYLAAVPLIVWMARSPSFAVYYLPSLKRAGAAVFFTYYFLAMLTEHFFFHGVMLACFRADRRWPPPPPMAAGAPRRVTRVLQWVGLAQPTAGRRGLDCLTRWIGLPDGCVVAILGSAFLFGVVHMGKDPRELLLSLPGGIGFAFLAYRTNSWLVPFALHLATAGTAYGMMHMPGG